MQALSFDSVCSLTDNTTRVTVWRGPTGDYAVGATDAQKPAGYTPLDLTGARLDLTIYKNSTVIAVISSAGESPQLKIIAGVGGAIQVTFVPANFSGWSTGIYDHAMKCTFPGGKTATLWVGPLTLISIPT